MEKRVVFLKNYQRKFIEFIKRKTKLNWRELGYKLEVKTSTLRISYRYKYCNLPFKLFKKACKLLNLLENFILNKYKAKIIEFKPIIGRKCIGESRTKLPKLTETNFNQKEIILDLSKINYSNEDKRRNIILPNRLTPLLAEEMGMHYGDGFLSKRRNEYRLKGNKDEKEYYDKHIANLYKTLFGLNLNIKEYETTYGFEISSKALWEFKNKVLNIPAGRKNNIDFPKIINFNNKEILASFLRGIFDTDGSVSFKSGYGLKSYYPRILLSLKSKKLIDGIHKALEVLGLKPKTYFNKSGYWGINLNGYQRLAKYEGLIGWSNPKHLKKVKAWKQTYPKLGVAVLI